MKFMFAITHARGHMRQLTRANQGRFHFDTLEAAMSWLQAVDVARLAQIHECLPGSIGVSKILCYDHGDAVATTWIDSDEFTDAGRAAFLNGTTIDECPYDEGTDGETGWKLGWMEEQMRAEITRPKDKKPEVIFPPPKGS